MFGPYDYPFSTTVAFNLPGVILEGAAGSTWAEPYVGTGYTRLRWAGTGSGWLIDASGPNPTGGTVGFQCRDLMLEYTSASFTGGLVNLLYATQTNFTRVAFDTTAASVSATQAVRAATVNTVVFDQCSFNGFTTYVTGSEAGHDFANVVHFRDCAFQGNCTQYVLDPSNDWRFSHCTFELTQGTGAGAMQYGITTTYNHSENVEVTLDDCDAWDASANTIKLVYAPSGNTWYFVAINLRDHNVAGGLTRLLDLQSIGSVTLIGGYTGNVIDMGDGTVNASHKRLIHVSGVDFVNGSTKNLLLNATKGHQSVTIQGNNSGTENWLGLTGECTTLSHERLHYVDAPAVALHTGVTGVTAQLLSGNDMAGVILLHNTTGSASSTGLLADVTMAGAPTMGLGVNPNGGALPCVIVTPFVPDDSGNAYVAANGPSSAACLPYGYAKSVRAGGSQGSWSLGVGAAIPAGVYVAFAYRVVHL